MNRIVQETTAVTSRCAEGSANTVIHRIWGRAILPAVVLASAICAATVYYIVTAVGREQDARLLVLIGLALLGGPITVRFQSARDGPIVIPLIHPVLFAGALTLGVQSAAVPAMFASLGRLICAEPEERKSIVQIAYIVLKPAIVCAIASSVYITSGGNPTSPHETASLLPVFWAGLAYVAASVLIALVAGVVKRNSAQPNQRASFVLTSWIVVIVAGWQIAILCALAPSYVLLAPIVVVGMFRFALRNSGRQSSNLSNEKEPAADETKTADSWVFVDPSTGLANRRYLEMFLSSELSRAERLGKQVSLAVFDIDGLPRLLESVDREKLDSIVGEIGRILKSGLREYDVVVRYSLGRLIVVLPEISPEQAFEVAERLHQSLESVKMGGDPVSVSAAIASFPDNASTVEELINSAHRALNRGRFQEPSKVYACERLEKAS